jgi:hypothetical protein
MKTLRTLGAAAVLIFVFTFAAIADCPLDPGIMNAPPCSGAHITPDDPGTPTEPSVLSTSGSASVVEISLTTVDVLLSALTIF